MKNLSSFSHFANVCLRFLMWHHRAVQNRNFLFLLLFTHHRRVLLFLRKNPARGLTLTVLCENLTNVSISAIVCIILQFLVYFANVIPSKHSHRPFVKLNSHIKKQYDYLMSRDFGFHSHISTIFSYDFFSHLSSGTVSGLPICCRVAVKCPISKRPNDPQDMTGAPKRKSNCHFFCGPRN